MQRLFSIFPDGAAGVALFVLRLCAAGSLLMSVSAHGQLISSNWIVLGLVSILILLGIGALTPIACVVAGLSEILCVFYTAGAERLCTTLAVLVVLSLALLGPGAYSVDAKMFGRRRIVRGRSPYESDPPAG